MKAKLIDAPPLELITQDVRQRKLFNLASHLDRIWNWLIKFVSVLDEPRISALKDKSGQAYWIVYDPCTGQKAYLSSESEVRT
jgi:hypothetical protein